MANMCKICSHPNRLKIDQAIVTDGNLSKIAQDFRVPYGSLYGHAKDHISRQLSQAWDKKQLEQDFNLLHRIDDLVHKAQTIFKRNYDKGKDAIALKALSEQRSTFELLAKISYALHQSKLAELELMRYETGEVQHEEQEEATERLKILTTPEIKVWQRIQIKLRKQDNTINCLTQKQRIEGGFMDQIEFPASSFNEEETHGETPDMNESTEDASPMDESTEDASQVPEFIIRSIIPKNIPSGE